MTAADTAPAVTILLGLYNGAEYLREQLDSFAGQSHRNWGLIVSDDGSTDAGPQIVSDFAAAHPGRTIRVIEGPRMGFARNFLHLLRQVGPEADYAALSDQDDAWLEEKLARGIAALAAVPDGVPALYGGRTWICDAALTPLRPSPLFTRPPGFRNALVQSIAGGNTMILNRAALEIVQAAAAEARRIVAHDWWLYQIVSGAGGQVIYDPQPLVLYRQHGENQIGANDTWRASLYRIGMVFKGRFRTWNRVNLVALRASEHRLTPENRALLDQVRQVRRLPLWRKLGRFRRLGLYRQSRRGNAALWLAVILGRF